MPPNPPGDNFARELGQDDNVFWNSTGRSLWDQVMGQSGLLFDNIGWDDLVADNSTVLMSTYVMNCRANPPLRQNQSGPYDSASCTRTLSAAVRKLKHKFRAQMQANTGDYFPDDLLKEALSKVRKDRQRNMMEGDEDSDLWKRIHPLPRKHNARTRLILDVHSANPLERQNSRNYDLLHVGTGLFRQAKFAELTEVLWTNNGIGRGGEVKFLNYKNLYHDTHFQMVFTQWFQRKILKSNPSSFLPDYESPYLCCFVALGCYWACQDGLTRPAGIGEPNSSLRRRSYFVFQHLHSIRDASVAGRIATHLRSQLPPLLREAITGKSLRYGTMSELAWDPQITLEEAVALGGWVTGSNRDYYVWQYLVAVIPAALCLAGYPDCRVLPYNPTCGVLFHSPQLLDDERLSVATYKRFVNALYAIDLPEFKIRDTPQRNLLVLVTACMVMHFDELYLKFGIQHEYCRKMVNSIMASGISAADTLTRAVALLQKYSRIVRDNFKKGNHPSETRGANNLLGRRTIQDEIGRMNTALSQLIASRVDSQHTLQQLHDRQDDMTEEISQLKTQLSRVLEICDLLVTQNRNQQLRLHELLRQQNVPITDLPETPATLRRSQVEAAALARHLSRNPEIANANAVTVTPNSQVAVSTAPREPFANSTSHQNTTPPNRQNSTSRDNSHSPGRQNVTPPERNEPTNRRNTMVRTPATVNNSILPHRVQADKSRGVMRMSQSLEMVLKQMYEAPGDAVFGPMKTLSGPLEDRKSWLTSVIFQGRHDRHTTQCVVRVLRLVDCLWTPEERNQCIQHTIPPKEVTAMFCQISDKARLVAWTIHRLRIWDDIELNLRKNNPKSTKPPTQVKKQMQGMSNNVGDFNLEPFLPDWRRAGYPRQSERSLWDEYQFELKSSLSDRIVAKRQFEDSRRRYQR